VKILVLGSGPSVIGQAYAFDDAAAQGCRALREAGFEVVLVDSGANTVGTDAETADRTYLEPLTQEHVARVIEGERPDALLPTLGGRTALRLAVALVDDGTLARFGVALIGAPADALRRQLVGEPAPPPAHTVGKKRVELEVARDLADRVAVLSAVESIDPVGVHAGDAIAVTPPQTLSDEVWARLSYAAAAAVRGSGLAAGVANVQLAVDADGHVAVIETSPLVSRASPLASMVTGVSIAGIAARLAAGHGLDEVPRPHDARAVAGCVVKVPRWAFEKFPGADHTLTRDMKSVGEAIAIGATFAEALGKALRALAPDTRGLTLGRPVDARGLGGLLAVPTAERLAAIADAYRAGWSTPEVQVLTRIDPWFLDAIHDLVAYEDVVAADALDDPRVLHQAKRRGFADARIAGLTGVGEDHVRGLRLRHGIVPAYRPLGRDDARCVYATYAGGPAAPARVRPSVLIVGGGPGRIGHGAGHDWCDAHAAQALRAAGVDAVLMNCSGASDAADRLYCEPLTLEDVLGVVEHERPLGTIVQLGGHTALELAGPLSGTGVPILGTQADALEHIRDPRRFGDLLARLGLTRPPRATVRGHAEARAAADRLGYPVLVRPWPEHGHVLRLAQDGEDLETVMSDAPVVLDKFLEDAIEIDVDAVADGRRVLVAGVMEHVEKAGIHGGDAACALPPYSLGPDQVDMVRRQTEALALALGVVGLVHVRFAVKNDVAHVLDVNLRASRTVPFVSKATGLPLVELAVGAMLGRSLPAIEPRVTDQVAVKEAVFPFSAFAGVDVVLGPDMKSTGEVMGLDADFRQAYLKAQLAAGARLPTTGKVWVSVRGADRRPLVMLAKRLGELGFTIVAAGDTARVLCRHGMTVDRLPDGVDERPRVLDLMRRGEIALAIDIPEDGRAGARSAPARREALRHTIPYYTTLDGARALIGALEVLLKGEVAVRALQDRLAA
jgi:carbamoyl-phosphate synthase large subunit